MRVGFIGFGPVVTDLHLPAIRRLGWAVSFVADRDRRRLDEAAVLAPEANRIDQDWSALPGGIPESDLVVVALPNHLHEGACRQLLDWRVPTLCEKPLTLTSEACRELGSAFAAAKVPLVVGMCRRFIPAVTMGRKILRRALLGEVISVRISHGGPYAWPSESGEPFRPENGGVLADMGVHYLDIARWWFGDLTITRYWDDWHGGVEAEAAVDLKTASGIPVRIELSRRRTLRNEICVQGSEANLVIDVDRFDACRIEWEHDQMRASVRQMGATNADFIAAFERQFEAVGRHVKGQAAILVDAFDQAATMSLIESCYSSRRSIKESPSQTIPSSANLGWRESVAITGATGFIGTRLVERLFDAGVSDVRAIVRGYRTVAGIARYPIRLERSSLFDIDALRRAFRGASTVVHLAFGARGTPRERRRTTIDGTRCVLEAAIAEGVESIVVLSTLWVLGFPKGDREFDETAAYKPYGGEYARSKATMERWALRRSRHSPKSRIVVLNPGIVYGPWAPTYVQLPAQLASENKFCWIENGSGICHYCYIDNLIDGIALAANEPQAHGKRFLIFDGRCTWREFLAPFVSLHKKSWKSLTARQLFSAQARTSIVDLIRVILRTPETKNILKKLPLALWGARVLRWANFKGKKQFTKCAGCKEDPKVDATTVPPAWISILFPDVKTQFTNAFATMRLKYKPNVSLIKGQLYSVRWLKTMESKALPFKENKSSGIEI